MDPLPTRMPTFRWRPSGDPRAADPARALSLGRLSLDEASPARFGEELAELAGDHLLAADELTRRVARLTHGWLVHLLDERSEELRGSKLTERVRSELAPLARVHGWRAPLAGFLAALAAAARLAPGGTAVLEECALWCEDRSAEEGESPWDGEPLSPGVRLPDRARVAAPFLAGAAALERGEVVIVHGWSETVARTLEAAHRAGLAPEAVVSEGGPDLGGRRLARRLAAAGLAVQYVYDAALFERIGRADRVWVGTEAVGAHAFLARVGTRALLQEARRAELGTAVLATSDKLMPGGRLELPAWGEDEAWLLWERPPAGVTLRPQPFEVVPIDHVDVFATELGLVSGAELSVRALRMA